MGIPEIRGGDIRDQVQGDKGSFFSYKYSLRIEGELFLIPIFLYFF